MSTNTTENRDLAPVHELARPSARTRVGLSALDRAATTAFASGDARELVEEARALAEALCGTDADAARTRMLARAMAACRTQQRVLEVILGERVAKRDEEGALLVSKVLDGVVRRLATLSKAAASEAALRQRPSVFVGRADVVNVAGAGDP